MDMTRKDELIAALDAALQAELKAIKMYAAHARAIADSDITQGLRTILEVEEGHARSLANRIMALEGKPASAEPGSVPSQAEATTDTNAIADMLHLDLRDEQWAIEHYAVTVAAFLIEADDDTLTVLEENLLDELRHARWLRDQLLDLNRSR